MDKRTRESALEMSRRLEHAYRNGPQSREHINGFARVGNDTVQLILPVMYRNGCNYKPHEKILVDHCLRASEKHGVTTMYNYDGFIGLEIRTTRPGAVLECLRINRSDLIDGGIKFGLETHMDPVDRASSPYTRAYSEPPPYEYMQLKLLILARENDQIRTRETAKLLNVNPMSVYVALKKGCRKDLFTRKERGVYSITRHGVKESNIMQSSMNGAKKLRVLHYMRNKGKDSECSNRELVETGVTVEQITKMRRQGLVTSNGRGMNLITELGLKTIGKYL